MAPRLGGCPDYASGGCRTCAGGWCCRRFGMASISVQAIKSHAPSLTSLGGGGGGGEDDHTEPPDGPPSEEITADEAIRRSWRRTISRWRAERSVGQAAPRALPTGTSDPDISTINNTKEHHA